MTADCNKRVVWVIVQPVYKRELEILCVDVRRGRAATPLLVGGRCIKDPSRVFRSRVKAERALALLALEREP